MRKQIKKQIIELLGTLNGALHYIKVTKRNDEGFILDDCLLCLDTICKSLNGKDSSESFIFDKARGMALILERARNYTGNSKEFRKKLFDLLRELSLIRNAIKKIQPRLEIVFLPYKASMWDSMESIWQASKKDEHCDAYVIPIPYYDMNQNRAATRLHYEGGLFPEDVPIVDYRQCGLAERRPDVIYIHNPYDGYNRVTSVAPDFYSEKLKQYTDMLVYVPYDVLPDLVGEHMCQMPGVINADRVIVQSERVKSVYAKYVPADKVLALGSPKIDKVLWTQLHKPKMPKSWDEIARGRKLILYNTHLTPLMLSGGNVCKKLRYVFSCFEGRNDVCLLWRPHPLSQATMESMNPEPLSEYMRLVDDYKRSGVGIYDDTADVHRAIALSDAYYGDDSSLIPMYGVTGKPIMMQDIDNQEDKTASFLAPLIDGNTMWFTAFYFNGLFKMDMETKRISFIGKFPEEQDRIWMYAKIMKIGKQLFFFPGLARSIAVFNLETSEIKMHSLEAVASGSFGGYGFFSVVQWKSWIYVLPIDSHVILKMNTVSGEIQYESDWYEKFRPYVKNEWGSLFSSVIQRGKYIWCPYWQGNLIVRFDLETLKFEIYSVGNPHNTYYNMCEGDGDFWIVTHGGDAVVRWNPDTQKTREYRQLPEEFNKVKSMFLPIYHEGFVWVLPAAGDDILKLNVNTGEFSIYAQYPENFKFQNKCGTIKYGDILLNEGMLTLYPIKANMQMYMNLITGQATGVELEWPDYCPSYFERFLNSEKSGQRALHFMPIYRENRQFSSLEGYLNYVAGHRQMEKEKRAVLFRKNISNSDGSCGKTVHQAIVELLNFKYDHQVETLWE